MAGPALSADAIAARIDTLCKPPGSLGRLEDVAARLAMIQQTLAPVTRPRRCVVFAADHGVTAAGVSAWPPEVTALVVDLMAGRRTASGVFAAALDCESVVVDVGLLRPVKQSGVADAAVRRGTADLSVGDAMTADEFAAAVEVGREQARDAAECAVVIGGEMGIGNTTPASCLVAAFTGQPAETVVGLGAGLPASGRSRKVQVVQDAVARVDGLDAAAIGAGVGGLEIAALAGFLIQAAEQRQTVLLDGFIATAAALLAERLAPGTAASMIAGHRSVEPGHRAALAALGLDPVLDLGLRLGEATGALAALPLVDLAAAMLTMATLDEVES